jgi:hypothetical protein
MLRKEESMRRFVAGMAVVALLMASATAFAETKEEKKSQSGLWEFGGGVKLSSVLRDQAFDRFFNRSGNPSGKNEFYIDARITLNLNIRLSHTANLFIQMETQDDAYAFESHRVGDNNQIITFEQGWLKVEEIFGGDLDVTLKIGLMDVKFETRNLGRDTFLLDITESENPFTGLPVLNNTANGFPSNTAHPSAYVRDLYGFSRNKSLGGNAWFHQYSLQSKKSEAGGAIVTWRLGKDVLLDLGALTVMEGGMAYKDTNIVFFNFDFEFDLTTHEKGIKKGESLDDRSLINVIAVGFFGDSSMVTDIGLGMDLLIDLSPSVELELYTEAHYQYGAKYYTETINLGTATADRPLIRHEAYGFYGGMRLEISDDSNMRPYFDFSYWRISGDRGDVDSENRDFMSMENVDTTLILEGNEVGFDIDCNYTAFKGEIGFHLPSDLSSIAFRITGGVFWLLKSPMDIVDVNIDGATGEYRTYAQRYTGTSRKNLGWEIDVRVIWEVSEEAKVFLAFGALRDSAVMHNVAELHGADNALTYTHVVLAGLEMKF